MVLRNSIYYIPGTFWQVVDLGYQSMLEKYMLYIL